MKLVNGFYYDSSNNRRDSSVFSENEAFNMSMSLFCCKECINCQNMIRCENCYGCSDCDHCKNSSFLLFCMNVVNSGNCYKCDCIDHCGPMINCRFCHTSSYLRNCQSCWICMNLENEKEVENKANFTKEEPNIIDEGIKECFSQISNENFKNWFKKESK